VNPAPEGLARAIRRRSATRAPKPGPDVEETRREHNGAVPGEATTPTRGATPAIEEFIARILRSERLGADVVRFAALDAEPASFAGLADPLPDPLASALKDIGIARPYSHQAEAIDRVRGGEDVLVVTPTASGKSLVYLVPVFEAALRRPGSRTLCLFPYKALAQDQLQGMVELAAATARRGGLIPDEGGLPGHGRPISAAIYDGDTPDTRRREIKADPPTS